jgi:methionyl-tRNA synthetase
VLTATAPETKDNDFTWKDFQSRNNNELVAIYGNFINRVLVLTHKYYEGKVPESGDMIAADTAVLELLRNTPKLLQTSLDRFRFREASQLLMNLARAGNKYLADQEPWKVIKTNPERVQSIMNTALQIAAGLAVLSEPFLPFTAKKLQGMLQFNTKPSWGAIQQGQTLLVAQHCIGKATLLFTKIEDAQIEAQLQKLKDSKSENNKELNVEAQKPNISFKDFSKMDLRVGTVVAAEKMPKTKKLLVLKVDIGDEVRTIVSGIAMDYAASEVLGQKVTVLCNLKPRALRGVESQGMILMSKSESGTLIFIEPDSSLDTISGMSIS